MDKAKVLNIKQFSDNRGCFMELYNSTIEGPWGDSPLIQQNFSRSIKGTFRGLHFQHKFPQGKLITLLSGYIIDCVVDLRISSQDFGKLQLFYLTTPSNYGNAHCSVWIPAGYAHGFFAKEDSMITYSIFGNRRDANDEYSLSPYSFKDLRKMFNGERIYMSEKDENGLDMRDVPVYE